MRRPLLRRLIALVSGLALSAGFLTLATAPAQAASFSVSVAASVQTALVGQTVTLTGKVGPKPSSRTLYLQRRFVGSTSWVKVKKFKAARSGAYRIVTRLTDDRDRYYRIYKPKAGKRKAGHSSAVQVIVNPAGGTPATVSSLSLTTQPLSGGSTVRITGSHFTGTTRVTMTPQVRADYTTDGSGVFPELVAAVTVIDDGTMDVTPPASVAGTNLVKIYTPTFTVATTLTYALGAHSASDFEKQVLDQLNLRRSSIQTCRGTSMPAVGPLSWDTALADISLAHARDLAARQGAGYSGLSHYTYGLKQWYQRFLLAGITSGFGEDLALSPETYSASKVVQQWMDSTDGHCESVMSGGWTKAGIGVARGVWKDQDSIWTNLDLR